MASITFTSTGGVNYAGGNVSGHLYLTGAAASSSTSNTSQIVFGTASNNHVALSSNTNCFIINPSTGATSGQCCIYVGDSNPRIVMSGNIQGNSITGTAVYGAVWNDLADAITVPAEDTFEPGYCYAMSEDGHYHKTSEYLQQSYIGIESDTYGFSMGENKEGQMANKFHSAIAGYVLAYVDQQYPVGTALTCTEDGYLTKMQDPDKINHPDLIAARYWKPELNETWGTGDRQVQVNGRHWVKIQ